MNEQDHNIKPKDWLNSLSSMYSALPSTGTYSAGNGWTKAWIKFLKRHSSPQSQQSLSSALNCAERRAVSSFHHKHALTLPSSACPLDVMQLPTLLEKLAKLRGAQRKTKTRSRRKRLQEKLNCMHSVNSYYGKINYLKALIFFSYPPDPISLC